MTQPADNHRPLPKAISAEEITNGTARLQEVLAAINDFSQEGFPYRDAARTKAESQLRECIKHFFGEHSHEFQTYRHYKLRASSKSEIAQSIADVERLIQTLEDRKLELQGFVPPSAAFTTTARTNPKSTAQMRLVPPADQARPSSQGTSSPLPSAGSTTSATTPRSSAAPIAQPSASSPTPTSQKPHATAPSNQPARQAPKAAAPPATPVGAAPSASATQEIRPTPAPPTHGATPAPGTPSQPAAPAATPVDATPSASATQEIHPVRSPQPHTATLAPEAPLQPVALQTSPAVSSSQTHSEQDPLQLIRKVCLRLHAVVRQLRLRKDSRPTVEVEDDDDLQDLLRALLKMEFDEVGVDEWTPPYAGSLSRTALLLNREQIALVAKKTRPGLTAKDIADQVKADSAFYSARNKCTTLFCFVYDPEGRIGSPKRLETDLTSVSDRYTVEVLVAPK